MLVPVCVTALSYSLSVKSIPANLCKSKFLCKVVAEAKDTGDYPMYGEAMLIQSAKWKQEDLLQYLQRVMG